MNQCLAPCIKKEPIDYKPIIQEITAFLKGDTKKVDGLSNTEIQDMPLSNYDDLEADRLLKDYAYTHIEKNNNDDATTIRQKIRIEQEHIKDEDNNVNDLLKKSNINFELLHAWLYYFI